MNIKLCVITPISHLTEYGSMGEMDMSLTHLIIGDKAKAEYINYYREQARKDRFVLLDNSAFEMEQQGRGLDPDAVLDAAEIIDPSEIIATDVLFDGPATYASTLHFIERMRARGVLAEYKLMAVPQGRTKEEWTECFEKLTDLEEVDTIGLSKLSVPMSFLGNKNTSGNCAVGRLRCTEYIEEHYPFAISSKEFHLLGGDNWTPWEIKQQTARGWIRSNDSSCAVWYGMHGKTFDEEGKIDNIIMEKPDLENENPETAARLNGNNPFIDVPQMIYRNIATWHMFSKGDVFDECYITKEKEAEEA